MISRFFANLLVPAGIFLSAVAAAVPQRVAILGDSITYAGRWATQVEYSLRSTPRFADAEIVNFGLSSETVSGLSEPGHAGGKFPRPCLHERLERILEAFKPTLILACYGMNDGIYLPLDEARMKAYQDGCLKLKTAGETSGATVVFITPPLFDADHPEKDGNHYDAVLDSYSQWLVSQRSSGWKVIDIRPDLKQAVAAEKLKNPAFIYANDNVHPGNEGHDFIATSVCKQLWPMLELPGSPQLATGDPLSILLKRSGILKHAWLTQTRHTRPGVPKGMPLDEANQQAAELMEKYRSASQPKTPVQATP